MCVDTTEDHLNHWKSASLGDRGEQRHRLNGGCIHHSISIALQKSKVLFYSNSQPFSLLWQILSLTYLILSFDGCLRRSRIGDIEVWKYARIDYRYGFGEMCVNTEIEYSNTLKLRIWIDQCQGDSLHFNCVRKKKKFLFEGNINWHLSLWWASRYDYSIDSGRTNGFDFSRWNVSTTKWLKGESIARYYL